MSVKALFLGILFIISFIYMVKVCYPSLLKKGLFKGFLLLAFYWAIGGLIETPVLTNIANEIGFIIFWSWLFVFFSLTVVIFKKIPKFLLSKNEN